MINEKQKQVIDLLAAAGKSILKIYESDDFQMELKPDNSPVTLADKTSSQIINYGLKQIYPEIAVLDEENSIPNYNERKNWSQYFLLDPLDGTKEFIKRNGEFCINLALIKNSKPIEGWIYQPLEKKCWYCKKDEGIVEIDDAGNIQKIEPTQNKDDMIRIVASRSFFKPLEAELINEIEKLYSVKIIHRGSSLKQIDIVKGNADLYLKAGPCSEWDTAPGQLMVEEIGGAVLRQNNFETMTYNKSNLLNPHFVMLNSHLNKPEFIDFIKDIILKSK